VATFHAIRRLAVIHHSRGKFPSALSRGDHLRGRREGKKSIAASNNSPKKCHLKSIKTDTSPQHNRKDRDVLAGDMTFHTKKEFQEGVRPFADSMGRRTRALFRIEKINNAHGNDEGGGGGREGGKA